MRRHVLLLTTLRSSGHSAMAATDRGRGRPSETSTTLNRRPRRGGPIAQGGMMGRGMMGGMGGRMMGGGMMMGPPMMRMIFALMDADGDGTISLQEFRRLTSALQGDGCQQRRPPYSGGDAVVYARGDETRPPQ